MFTIRNQCKLSLVVIVAKLAIRRGRVCVRVNSEKWATAHSSRFDKCDVKLSDE